MSNRGDFTEDDFQAIKRFAQPMEPMSGSHGGTTGTIVKFKNKAAGIITPTIKVADGSQYVVGGELTSGWQTTSVDTIEGVIRCLGIYPRMMFSWVSDGLGLKVSTVPGQYASVSDGMNSIVSFGVTDAVLTKGLTRRVLVEKGDVVRATLTAMLAPPQEILDLI